MSIRNFSMYQGAILGSLLVLAGLLFHFFGVLTCEKPIITIFINTILMFVILFLFDCCLFVVCLVIAIVCFLFVCLLVWLLISLL